MSFDNVLEPIFQPVNKSKKCTAFDNQIIQLYGLTEEEINIVEGK